MQKAVRCNGRPRGPCRSNGAAPKHALLRRNGALHVGLALLVAACCFRLAAELWQQTGGGQAFLLAVTTRRTGPLDDSASLYSNDTAPAPIDSVLTPEVVYGGLLCHMESARRTQHACRDASSIRQLSPLLFAGFLRLQYGRESIPSVDLRARAALEFPGVRPVHTTNASGFDRLLVASLQPQLQVGDLCTWMPPTFQVGSGPLVAATPRMRQAALQGRHGHQQCALLQ
jgi:hypothetical protein